MEKSQDEEFQGEDMNSFVEDLKLDYLSNPESQPEEGIELLQILSLRKNYTEMNNLLNNVCLFHPIPQETWLEWLESIKNEDFSNKETVAMIIEWYETSLSLNNYEKIAESYISFLELLYEGKFFKTQILIKKLDWIVSVVSHIVPIGKLVLDKYFDLVQELESSSGFDKNKLLIKILEKRFELPLPDNQEYLASKENLVKIDDLKKNELNELIKTNSYDQLVTEKYNNENTTEELFEFVEKIKIENKPDKYILYGFELVLDGESFEQEEVAWTLFVELLRSSKDNKQLLKRTLKRYFVKSCQNLEFVFEFLTCSKDSTELDEAFNKINQRIYKKKQFLYSVWEYYFLLMISFGRRDRLKPEIQLANLDNTLTYLSTLYSSEETKSNQLRGCMTRIYKRYVDHAIKLKNLGTLESSDVIPSCKEKCENIVKFDGNNPASWIYYKNVLEQLEPKNTEKIISTLKRGMTFCNGDISKLYNQLKEFEIINTQVNYLNKTEADKIFEKVIEKRSDRQNLQKSQYKYFPIGIFNKEKFITEVKEPNDSDKNNTNDKSDFEKKKQISKDLFEEKEKHKETLFVSNLPIGYSREELLENISDQNKILEVRIINRKSTNSSQAYIDFDKMEDALKCKKELFGTIIEGRRIHSDISDPKKARDTTNTLFVNNLPFNLSEDTLAYELQLDRSQVVQIRLKRSFAFIKYANEEFMKKDRKRLHGKPVRGRNLIVKIALDKSREKSKTEPNSKGSDTRKKTLELDPNKNSKANPSSALSTVRQGMLAKRVPPSKQILNLENENVKKDSKEQKSNEDFRKLMGLS